MGIFTDLLNNAKSWDSGEQTGANSDTVAGDRAITKEIKAFKTRQGDPDLGNDFTAGDEVQSIAAFPVAVSSGNFTLTIDLKDEDAFTTANLAYDDNAATIETAIDVAATTAGITDWTNADISVALTTTLNAGAMTVTYDGDSVDDLQQGPIVINDVDMTADPLGAVAEDVQGVVAVNEVQQIPKFTGAVDGGSFTLTLNIVDTEITTANIAWNASVATIEIAIDTVATGNVVGWSNGDVALDGTNMSNGTSNFTYVGPSVDSTDVPIIVITNVDLTNGDVDTPSTLVTGVPGVNEVQSVAIFPLTPTSGNYTLNFTLSDATNFITGNIAYGASAATIETAIDVAATAEPVPAWANGDITVSGGPLTTDAVLLTFDGSSVYRKDHSATVVADVNLDGYAIPGAVTTTTQGQSTRTVWEVMEIMGLVAGGPPVQGTTSGLSAPTSRISSPHYPRQATLQALAQQAAIDDESDDIYGALMALFGQTHTL
jgi:hypothetical protein